MPKLVKINSDQNTYSHRLVSSYSQILKPYIRVTPIISSPELDKFLGLSCYFKCENLQITDSFKVRGAYCAVIKLLQNSKDQKLTLATHSSGNHGIALSHVAKTFNLDVHIVVPDNTSSTKLSRIQSSSRSFHICAATTEARQQRLEQVIQQYNAAYVPSANDSHTILGQASCAYEVFKAQNDEFDYIVAPIGGGGLLAGTCLAANYFSSKCKVIGAEPELANDCAISIKNNQKIELPYANTLADGLRVPLASLPWEIIKQHTHEVLTCSEDKIVEAMQLIKKYLNFNVEPSAAVPLASLLNNLKRFSKRKVVFILSGGNISQAEVEQIYLKFI